MRSKVSIEWVIGIYLRSTICPVITISVDILARANNELLIEHVFSARARFVPGFLSPQWIY